MLTGEMPSVSPVPTSLNMALAGRPVAVLLGPLEPLGMNRQNRNAGLLAHPFAHRLHIVSDDAHDAGGVYKRRLGRMLCDELRKTLVEFIFAAEYYLPFPQIRGKTQSVEFGTGRNSPPDIPRVGSAPDGAVNKVKRIGDGIQHHPGATEHTGPLTDGAGNAVLFTRHVEGLFALLKNLRRTLFQDGYFFRHNPPRYPSSCQLSAVSSQRKGVAFFR